MISFSFDAQAFDLGGFIACFLSETAKRAVVAPTDLVTCVDDEGYSSLVGDSEGQERDLHKELTDQLQKGQIREHQNAAGRANRRQSRRRCGVGRAGFLPSLRSPRRASLGPASTTRRFRLRGTRVDLEP